MVRGDEGRLSGPWQWADRRSVWDPGGPGQPDAPAAGSGHRVGGNARVLVTAADDLVRAQFKVATNEYIGQGK
jgi:hypothetical protein